jgi:SAM-dependent methyltransferase
VSAVDAEPSMVDLAQHNVPAARVCVGVLPHLPYPDDSFDAVVANFVINHVGDPGAAVSELRRVVRPGGRIGVTVWPHPAPPLQNLWQEIMRAAGVTRPATIPTVSADRNFDRTPAGLTGLLRDATLAQVSCQTIAWQHHTSPQEWWTGPANGIGALGVAIAGQPAHVVAQVRQHYDNLTAQYLTEEGILALPTAALLASATR